MTANYHTPPVDGAPANMSVIRAPLSELDSAITDHETRIGTLEGDMPVPSGVSTEYYNGNGGWTVPAGTGASVDGHVIKDEGTSLPQRASIDFTGGGVAVTNEAGGTRVEIPGVRNNILINGGFDFAQRQSPITLTTIAQDKYSADRWRISRENSDLQYQREDGLSVSGLTSSYFGTYKKITNAGKMMVYQIVEGVNSVSLRGKTVTFQAKLKASSAKTIRMAILELQAAGSINVIPSTFVSAYGANGVDPTFGTNLAIITAAQSKSVTTVMQIFSVSVTVPVDSKNLICAIWTDSQFSAGDTLSVAEAGFYQSAAVQEWMPEPISVTLSLCERYFEKSFGYDVAPATNVGTEFVQLTASVLSEIGCYSSSLQFRVQKFATPTLTYYNPFVASNTFSCSTAAAASASLAPETISSSKTLITHRIATGTAYILFQFHFTAEAEL